MAHDTAKKNSRRNAQRLWKFRQITVGINLCYLFLCFYFNESFVPNWGDVLAILFWFGQEWVLIAALAMKGAPSLDEQGEIVDCADLAKPEELGMFSYAQDTLWICWFVQCTTIAISSWFWTFYAIPPAFALYKAWGFIGAPLLGRLFGGGGPAAGAPGQMDMAPGMAPGSPAMNPNDSNKRPPQNRRERRAAEKAGKR